MGLGTPFIWWGTPFVYLGPQRIVYRTRHGQENEQRERRPQTSKTRRKVSAEEGQSSVGEERQRGAFQEEAERSQGGEKSGESGS